MSTSSSPKMGNSVPQVHDVIIIGAGPCGLAVAARLKEQAPSSLFTDEEHRRYHWARKHSRHASIKNFKTGHEQTAQIGCCPLPSTLVLDSSGTEWMTRWNNLFSQLQITHLRSPMFFHPDPHDRDGLLSFAHAEGRQHECVEIGACVGKEISKHKAKQRRACRNGCKAARPPAVVDERDRKDYFTPPTTLFKQYCESVTDRYGLSSDHMIRQSTVANIDYDIVPDISVEDKVFTVSCANGQPFHTRSVVLAVGAGNRAKIPLPFLQDGCPKLSHALVSPLPKDLKGTKVLVVGGGLTSAQIADKAIRDGASKVWLLMRGPLKIKPFDVDLSWMGKFRNHEKARFWSADDDEERLRMIKEARGGGSITSLYAKRLQQHMASGKLSLHTQTTVLTHAWLPSEQFHEISTSPPILDLPKYHHICLATGVDSNIETLPYLQTMLAKHPIQIHAGLPALTDDLMWNPDVPLFVTGKLAALRLGPGAGNLEGARVGAERIAWALADRTEDPHGESSSSQNESYINGVGSRFDALAVAEPA